MNNYDGEGRRIQRGDTDKQAHSSQLKGNPHSTPRVIDFITRDVTS